MDEKIRSILACLKGKAAVIGSAAAEAAGETGAKARDMLAAGKMNLCLTELETTVLTELRHAGEMIYATHTGNPTDSEVLLAKLREIDELYARIAQLKREIAVAKRIPVCGVCGRVGEKGDLYCRDCGCRLQWTKC